MAVIRFDGGPADGQDLTVPGGIPLEYVIPDLYRGVEVKHVYHRWNKGGRVMHYRHTIVTEDAVADRQGVTPKPAIDLDHPPAWVDMDGGPGA